MSLLAWIVLARTTGRLHRQQDRQQARRRPHPGHRAGNRGSDRWRLPGALFRLPRRDPTGLNLYSLLIAVIGAVVVMVVYHAFRGARCSF